MLSLVLGTTILIIGCDALSFEPKYFNFGKMTDIDGNVYKTIQICDQIWMAENLKVTHYRNGDEIPTSNSEWNDSEEGKYAVYGNDSSNIYVYGNLYNWYTVDDERGLCPEGWYVPTDDEWTILTDCLGGVDVAGDKMKEIGTEHWIDDGEGIGFEKDFSEKSTNESGFTGFPGGYRDKDYESYNDMGYYGLMNYWGFFWSSTEALSSSAWYRELSFNDSGILRSSSFGNEPLKSNGFSVRCIRD